MPTDLEPRVVHEARMAEKTVGPGNAFDLAQREPDRTVALAPHPIHDRAAIDAGGPVITGH
jgi:hypothetical protein